MNRLRIIAGPNGSGKTTLTRDLHENYHLNFGHYVNADDIEKKLKKNKRISFRKYKLTITPNIFESFFNVHPLASKESYLKFVIKYNTLYLPAGLNNFSYFAALLADFIR